MEKGRAIEFECLRCDARHQEAYNERKNAHCKSCGNIAYPVEDQRARSSAAGRKCKGCGTALRKGNGSSMCAACDP
jgi:hypothetical protein